MSITAARLQAEVDADTKGFDKGMAHADTTIKNAPSKWATALKVGAGAALAVGGALVVKGIAGAIRGGLDSLTQQGVVVAQTNAVIKSTGAAAGVTAGQIRDLSTALEAKTTVDDKVVQADANLLLTFTNVKNAVGAGNDIFDQSVAIFEDMKTSLPTANMLQLGKAMNDPVTGATALTRAGVSLTAQQKAQLKASGALSKEEEKHYVALGKTNKASAERYKAGILSNKLLASQKMILKELNTEFGGAGAAFAATDAGKALKYQDAIEGIEQALTGALLPAITRIRGALTDFLGKPETVAQVTALGDAIASIFSEGNIKTAASLMTTAANAIGSAIKLFTSLPPEIQALAVSAFAVNKLTGGLVTTLVKGVAGIGLNLIGGATTGAEIGGAMTAAGAVAGAEIAGAMTGAGAVAGAEAAGAIAVAGTGAAVNVAAAYTTAAAEMGASRALWSKAGTLIGGAFAIVAVAALAEAIYPMISPGGGYKNRVANGTDTLPTDQLSWPWGPKNTPDINLGEWGPLNLNHLLGGDSGVTRPGAVGADIGAGSTWAGGHGKQLFATPDATSLSGRLTSALKSTKLSVNAAEMATPLISAFMQSVSPSQRSMASAMEQLKGMQAKYLAQGDTVLAASIGRDIAMLNQTIIDKKFEAAMTIVGSDWAGLPKPKAPVTPYRPPLVQPTPKPVTPYHPPLVQPAPKPVAVVLSPRLIPNAGKTADLYGPTTSRNGRAVAVG